MEIIITFLIALGTALVLIFISTLLIKIYIKISFANQVKVATSNVKVINNIDKDDDDGSPGLLSCNVLKCSGILCMAKLIPK